MSEKLQERRWLAQNPREPWGRAKVVAAASHPGAVNATAPVVNELVRRGAKVTYYTAGAVNEEQVPEFSFSRDPNTVTEHEGVVLPRPDDKALVALLSVSTPPDIDRCELLVVDALLSRIHAGSERVIVTLTEDNTPGLRPVFPLVSARGLRSGLIDGVFLTTGSAARAYPDDEFGVPRSRMKVTGSASFDWIKAEDTDEVNRETRDKLGIPLETIAIAHFGMPSQQQNFEGMEPRTTRAVSRAVTELSIRHPDKHFVFLHRQHGREEHSGVYPPLLPEPRENFRVIPHEESKGKHGIETRGVEALTDLSIALTSTVLTEVSLRGALREPETLVGALWGLLSGRERIPHPSRRTGWMPLYYFNNDAVSINGHPDCRYEVPAPIQLNAAAVAWNSDRLVPTMERALFDFETRRRIAYQQATALKAEYAFDPKVSSAGLIVAELETLLAENR